MMRSEEDTDGEESVSDGQETGEDYEQVPENEEDNDNEDADEEDEEEESRDRNHDEDEDEVVGSEDESEKEENKKVPILQKYVPPHLRQSAPSDVHKEMLLRIKRQMKGLFNRYQNV